MACLDREKFAYAVAGVLHARGIRTSRQAQSVSGVSSPTWNRLSRGGIISADSFAAVCKFCDLDARDFVNMDKPNPHSQHGRTLSAQSGASAGVV